MQTVNKWLPADGISSLAPSEMADPFIVLKRFSADFPLLAMKELFSTMTDLCVMAEDVCAPTPKARQSLFNLSIRIAKVLEAIYLIVERDKSIIKSTELAAGVPEIHTVRVYRARWSKQRADGARPVLTFCGDWLYNAGFHIGDEVKIATEAGRLLLTVSRQWNRAKQKWHIRT